MAKKFESPDNNSNWWNKFPNGFVQEGKEKFGRFSNQGWNYTRTKWFTWIAAYANEKRRNILGNEQDDFGISITKNSCFIFSTSENEFEWNPKYGWKCSRRNKYNFKRGRTGRFGIWTQKCYDYLAKPTQNADAVLRSKRLRIPVENGLSFVYSSKYIFALCGNRLLILHKCSFYCPLSIWLLKNST